MPRTLLQKHRLIRQDPSRRLSRAVRLTTADTNITTADLFGDATARSKPVTFAFTLLRSGAAAGLIFEFGSATRGGAAYVSSGTLVVVAGAGTGSADDGVTLSIANALPDGKATKFVVTINPGKGTVKVWRRGTLIGQATAVNAGFGGAWTDTAAGAVGNVQGAANNRVPGGSQVALANCQLVGGLDVYLRQYVF